MNKNKIFNNESTNMNSYNIYLEIKHYCSNKILIELYLNKIVCWINKMFCLNIVPVGISLGRQYYFNEKK